VAEFPSDPVSPQAFMDDVLPGIFAAHDLPDGAGAIDIKLGVRLEGEDGGDWLLHLADGKLDIRSGTREGALITIIQTVDDWRGALWEGRGGVFGEQAGKVFREGAVALPGAGAGGAGLANPGALQALDALNGVIRIVVTGGAGGDWATGIKLGTGDIPAEPTTSVTIAAEDAEAMARGELDPMSAFMGGKVQIAGDMTLMMQMQAIAMQAAMPPPGGGA